MYFKGSKWNSRIQKRIINKQIYEYENISAVTHILMPDKSIREIEMPPLHYFKSFKEWNEYIQYKKKKYR